MLTEYYTGEEDFEEWKQTGNTIKLYHVLPNRMQGTAGKTSRFDFASKEVLYSSILGGFTKKELRLMRNEIYARHGYRFSSPDMNEYFSQCPWYSPRGDNNAATAELTEVEKINVQLIKKMEKTPQY
ncbi:YARHG domain-containing protein [Prevotella sp. OH937_COT-195]|nr:YARHG domain-containing protein [Prevotella sp. OH937_COT-195]